MEQSYLLIYGFSKVFADILGLNFAFFWMLVQLLEEMAWLI